MLVNLFVKEKQELHVTINSMDLATKNTTRLVSKNGKETIVKREQQLNVERTKIA
jgi:hypothetical protein